MGEVLVPPDWLDATFIKQAIKMTPKYSSLVVDKFEIGPATALGDNFISEMFRAVLHFTDGSSSSFVIKSLPKGAFMEKLVRDCLLFVVETRMLTEAMPRIMRMLSAAGYGTSLSAQVLYHQGPPRDLIIMEDLCRENYNMAPRMLGLGLSQTRAVLERLALLHAGSLGLLKEDPALAEAYSHGYWVEANREIIGPTIPMALKALAEEVAKWEDTPPCFADKIRRSAEQFFPKMFQAYSRGAGLNVLTHGDPWTNNLMFQYADEQEQTISDMKFVDFQLASYRSPVIDLQYFLFSSPQNNIRMSNFDWFLQVYFDKLVEVCERVQVHLHMTLEHLHQDFQHRLFYGFVIAAWTFPITIAPPSESLEMEDMKNKSNFECVEIFQTQRFVEGFKEMLPYFEQHGVFH